MNSSSVEKRKEDSNAKAMGRKKKLVHESDIPLYAIERFARCVFDDIREDYANPEIQADFQRWLAEREQNKKKKLLQPGLQQLLLICGSISYGQTVTVVCMLIRCEINK